MTITTSIYDLMIKSALVFNILFILLNYKKYNLKLKDAILIIILENIFIVIGGKVFTYLDEFVPNILANKILQKISKVEND